MKRFLIGVLLAASSLPALYAQPAVRDGVSFLEQRKYQDAAVFFANIVKLYPRDAASWLYLSQAYLGTGQPDSAEFAGRKAVQFDDENPVAYATLAEALIELRKLAEANETLREGIDESGERPELLLQLGNLQLASDSTDAALVTFTRATVLTPDMARAYEGMGDVYARQGVAPMAVNQWERSLQLDPRQPGLLNKLAEFHLENRRYNDAVRAFQKVVDLDPDNQDARFKLGNIYYRAKLYSRAAKVFQEFVKSNPNDTAAVKMYIESLFHSRLYQTIPKLADRALTLDPTFTEAIRMKAVSHYALKEYKEAVDAYGEFEKVGEMSAQDYQYLGKCNELIENNEGAVVAYEKAVAIDSSLTNVMNDAGTAYMRLKKWEDAARMFRARFTADSSAVTAYINYAQCMLVLERFDEAALSLVVAIESAPDYVPSYTNLGIAYLQMKDYPKAKSTFEKAIAVIDTATSKYGSDLAKAYRYIGLTQLLDKEWDDAIENLRRSLQFEPKDENTLLWLAQGLQNAQGEAVRDDKLDRAKRLREDAIKYYKEVLKLNKNNEQAQKGLKALEGNSE